MNIDTNVLTLIGFVLTWLVFIFGAGVAYGKISARIDLHDSQVVDIRTEVKKILSSFSTPEGEPRFITYAAHDELTDHCRGNIALQIGHIKTSNDELKTDVKSMVAELKKEMSSVTRAVNDINLYQATHFHRRKTDDQEEVNE